MGRLRIVLAALAAVAGAAHAQGGGAIDDRLPRDPADRAAPAAPARPATPAPETPSPAPATPVSVAAGTSDDGGMTVVLIVGGVLLGALLIAVATPPRWRPKGHASPYPDHPVPGPQPEEEPSAPVGRIERRAGRERDVPHPAGPRRRNVAIPDTDGGTAVAAHPVATAVTAPSPVQAPHRARRREP